MNSDDAILPRRAIAPPAPSWLFYGYNVGTVVCRHSRLRKDFVVHPYQVVEAAAYGADLVLLIVAALPQVDLTALLHEAARHELAAIVEVHDEHELARALDAGAEIVGVNARDLTTLWRSTARPSTPAPRLPDDVVAVAESGVRGPADVVAAPVEAGVRPDP